MNGEESPAVVYAKTRISQQSDGRDSGSLRIEGIQAQREPYYQFLVWMHFAGRLREVDSALNVEKLNDLLFALSSTDRRLHIDTLAALCGILLGTLFGDGPQKQALAGLIRELKQKGGFPTVNVLERFLWRFGPPASGGTA